MLHIRLMATSDIPSLVSTFASHQWPKPASVFSNYLDEQAAHKRLCWIAMYDQALAGYVTLAHHSKYPYFNNQGIAEIVDLNVLPPFRGKGIGKMLLQTAENTAFETSNQVGLGVGLYPDYGPAQALYISQGYKPDGRGISYDYRTLAPGETTILDDDLVLWFTKSKA